MAFLKKFKMDFNNAARWGIICDLLCFVKSAVFFEASLSAAAFVSSTSIAVPGWGSVELLLLPP
jgi:hypothetical protein